MRHGSQFASQIKTLTELNLDDLFKALGLHGLRTSVLQHAFRPAASRLAQQIASYDQLVAEIGVQASSAWLLGQFGCYATIRGQLHVPRAGPLLIVANHPGLYDSAALFAAIPRGDLRALAADRPFLRALPNTSEYLITLGTSATGRMTAVRSTAQHLRAGGAALLFPGGKIEPDPASMPGAIAALGAWSTSIDMFGRLVPNLTIVPAIVSGVLAKAALHHPLTYLRRSQADRELLAATLQIIVPALHRGPVHVAFGPPLHGSNFVRAGSPSALGPAVVAAAAQLISCVGS